MRLTKDSMTTDVSVRVFQDNQTRDGQVHIDIEDKSSGVRVAQITISAVDFANAVVGAREGKATCEWRGLELIGKTYEVKSVEVDHPEDRWRDKDKARAEIMAAVKDELIDGWFVAHDGLSSQQNGDKHVVGLGRYVVGLGRYVVGLGRYVEPGYLRDKVRETYSEHGYTRAAAYYQSATASSSQETSKYVQRECADLILARVGSDKT